MSAVVSHEPATAVDGQSGDPFVLRLWERRAAFKPFAIAGSTAVLAGGGLAAAIAAPTPTRHGVWAAAFLVLVVGVSQLLIGTGLALLPDAPPPTRVVTAVVGLYNVGGLAVMLGITGERLIVFNLGSAALFAGLVLAFTAVRRSTQRGPVSSAYRLLLLLLVVCIPVGSVLNTLGPH